MRRAVLFVAGLVVSLALLAWTASVIVQSTTRGWFERDLGLRAELAVNGARRPLISHWRAEESADLQNVLTEIAHDERIMGAAACAADLSPLASTDDFPAEFACGEIAGRVQPAANASTEWTAWKSMVFLPGGAVHVSAIPLRAESTVLGFVVLLQDLSFMERREATTQRFLVLAFAFLAAAGSLVTIVAARLSWSRWTKQLGDLLRGGRPSAQFTPVLQDVRHLVERIVAEREGENEAGAWTPERLKHTLDHQMQGQAIVVVANREPYIHERADDGSIRVAHPASGVVTALEPVMRACSGVWIAHGSGSADRDVVDEQGRVRVPPDEESYSLRRLWLSPEEEQGYYYGFANEGLWPLCHIAHARPFFRSDDWRHYRMVNHKFAEAVCQEVTSEDPVILVQDYHFALLPCLIRKRLPRATVIMFWHIPWPNSERLGICPWREDLLEGMLGASILGFHTQFHCNNFIDSVDRFLEARIDRERNAVVQHQRATLVRSYPISLEWPVHWATAAPAIAECRTAVLTQLGLRPDALIGVGVDRLDYTKGIEERLLAVERLLELFPEFLGRFTFVQLAAPSRTKIERYSQLNESVEHLADRINQRFAGDGYHPVILLRSHHEPPEVFRFYRAADLCYVSSLHDGMNLVAKEFVAARDDERGVLLLSQFTGAAAELTEALIVNPYDLDEVSAAMATALRMSAVEQQARMRAMRRFVAEFNIYRWAGRMLVDAARLRRREQLTGRLTDHRALDGA
jgi:trehalose 6-phosphate synthase